MNNEIIEKINEMVRRLNTGCDLAYLEENTQFVLNVGKQYNEDRHSFSKKIQEIQLYRYKFISIYFLTYMAKKYNMYFNYNIFSEKNYSYYSQFYNCINISKNYVGRLDFEHLVFIIFHEFRHRMQHYDMDNDSIDNILNIDPATIIFIKEEATQKDRKLYDNNHECFFKENDANLFALSECELFFKVNLLKKIYRQELTNYISAMIQGLDLSDQEYHDKQSLPIIYEVDYRYKTFVLGKKILDNSLLGMIYKSDGTPKTYDELLSDKIKLIKKFKGQKVNKKTSTTDYIQWRNPRSAEDHIEEIYKLIIASDPLLVIQQYLYKCSTIKDNRYVKVYVDKIIKLLDDCPQLTSIYYEQLKSILLNELRKGNMEFAERFVAQNEIFEAAFKNYIQSHSKPVSVSSDEYEMNKEKVPFSANTKSLDHKPIMGEHARKAEKIHQQKQKLNEMKQQILNAEQKKKYEQEQRSNREEQEEDFGMSM